MRPQNLFVCVPKFIKFLSSNVTGVVVDQFFFGFRYVDPFWRYLRSKSKVVRNRAEIWTFFGLPKNFENRPGFDEVMPEIL